MKCMVFGATGYTGEAVVELATKRQHEVVAHIRPGSSKRDEASAAFEELGATVAVVPWEESPLVELIASHRPDAIFCLIGTTRHRMKELEKQGEDAARASYQAVDYGLTDLLVRASSRAMGDTIAATPTFVYISSMGISTEKEPRGNAYMKARWQAEQSILSSALHAVIARPAFISGEDREEDRLGERLGAVVSDTILKGLGALGAKKLEKTYRSMDADELATALLDLAEASVAQRQDATTPNHRIVEAYDLKR